MEDGNWWDRVFELHPLWDTTRGTNILLALILFLLWSKLR
jgi:hypothetical protein